MSDADRSRAADVDLNKNPEELEADINRTRAQISEDVDALSYQLSPERFKEQAQETLQGAQDAVLGTVQEVTDSVLQKTKEASSSLVDIIREHPLPATLVGLGVALLAVAGGAGASRMGGGEDDYAEGRDERYARGRSGRVYVGGGSYEGYSAYDSGYDTDTYGDTYNSNSASWQGSGDERSLGERAGAYQEGATRQARRAGSGLAHFIEERPLAAGVITVLVGAAIGLALPGTRREDELMGSARENVVGRAKEVAQKTLEEAKGTAQEELDKQGFTGEGAQQEGKSLLEKGKEVARKTAEAAKETAKRESE